MALSANQIADLWVQEGGNPAAAKTAAAIALAESSGNPSATNHNNNGTIDRGLFQINSIHGALSTHSLRANVKAAIRISGNGANWKPWVTYNTGAFKKYLGGRSSSPGQHSPATDTQTRSTQTRTLPGQSFASERAAVRGEQAQNVLSFLQTPNSDPLDFAIAQKGYRDQLSQLQDIPSQVVPGAPGSGVASGGSSLASTALQRANAIDAQRLPYKWGGGHQGKTALHDAVPLDCSGAVSKVLGIDPRVSGQFGSWGSPGDGGNKGVTIYSNGHHVLMKINGHFFGTSATNPGGGAGWIPAGNISSAYLKNFTARHSS